MHTESEPPQPKIQNSLSALPFYRLRDENQVQGWKTLKAEPELNMADEDEISNQHRNSGKPAMLKRLMIRLRILKEWKVKSDQKHPILSKDEGRRKSATLTCRG